jgi:hypothetical protein
MAKNLITRNARNDLKTAYMTAFDNFSTEPVEVGNAVNGNSRYGRELLGTLVNAGLVVTTDSTGDLAWQCEATYDNVSREEAEATFEAWVAAWERDEDEEPVKPAKKAAKKAAVAVNPANLPVCACGCGIPVNYRTAMYKPGHDARHAGQIGRLAASRDAEERELIICQLPTEALRTKARRMVENIVNKPAKAARKGRKAVAAPVVVEPVEVAGTVKKGRWTYPGLQRDGVTYISRSRKNTNEWDEADAKVAATFTAS